MLSSEQAVAAPFCSSRLADGGARVIKVERAVGLLDDLLVPRAAS